LRIGDYHANVTRWLPEAAEQRMRLAASAVNHNLDASTYSRQIAERFIIDLPRLKFILKAAGLLQFSVVLTRVNHGVAVAALQW
jgi:hypothetical protein